MFYVFDMGHRVGLVTDQEDAKEKGYIYIGEKEKEEDAFKELRHYFGIKQEEG